LVEQDQPFDADEVTAKAKDWASRLENSGLPPGSKWDTLKIFEKVYVRRDSGEFHPARK
jgi:hypothetical protein